MMDGYILALDQGTTSSRAMLFNKEGRPVAAAQQEFQQIFPFPGHVEHEPEVIWTSQLSVARQAMENANVSAPDIAAIGIANQRETTILWERDSGRPVGNAIVWQSRISAPICERLKADGLEPMFRSRTGLVIDPYFSATKIAYLLDSIDGLRSRARAGEILFGTVDTYLIWRLTGGKQHVTDYSNASRTLLFNIYTLQWDEDLLKALQIPSAMLPEVVQSSEIIGTCQPEYLGGPIPIGGVAGDQQAATFGQACFEPGMAKNTYGTGCFLLLNTGSNPVPSANGLLTTVGWSFGNRTTYCLEGAVFIAGAVVQWLRDGLGLIQNSQEIEQLTATVTDSGGVMFVPAFVGLGAPHWDPYARGMIIGITRDTRKGHIARAAIESMAYQTGEVLDAMQRDSGLKLSSLRVDGGACVNDGLLQFQADLLGVPVLRPTIGETTALGAAYLAGLSVGYWEDTHAISRHWSLDREFVPAMTGERRDHLVSRWNRAVARARKWEQ